MKSHIGLISVLTVLAAVIFLSVLLSCNDRGAQLRQALAAADSLMMSTPEYFTEQTWRIDYSNMTCRASCKIAVCEQQTGRKPANTYKKGTGERQIAISKD